MGRGAEDADLAHRWAAGGGKLEALPAFDSQPLPRDLFREILPPTLHWCQWKADMARWLQDDSRGSDIVGRLHSATNKAALQ